MKIRLIGSAIDTKSKRQFAASYLVNETIAIDAGTIGFMDSIDWQKRINYIVLSHTHIDHLASLPIFLDNVYVHGPECVTILAGEATQDCLLRDFFNERVWPDLYRLSQEESPFFRFELLEHGKPVTLDGVTITPLTLDHVTPTFGFLIQQPGASVAIISDTGPVDQVWDTLNAVPDLQTVFLESAFPNRLDWLAEKAKHLTPQLFAKEVSKLRSGVDVIAVHIKPAFYDEVVAELDQLKLPQVSIASANVDYEFGTD